jgi:hypothetical protein
MNIAFSNTFENVISNDMGLQFDIFAVSPFLNTGTISVCFKRSGSNANG